MCHPFITVPSHGHAGRHTQSTLHVDTSTVKQAAQSVPDAPLPTSDQHSDAHIHQMILNSGVTPSMVANLKNVLLPAASAPAAQDVALPGTSAAIANAPVSEPSRAMQAFLEAAATSTPAAAAAAPVNMVASALAAATVNTSAGHAAACLGPATAQPLSTNAASAVAAPCANVKALISEDVASPSITHNREYKASVIACAAFRKLSDPKMKSVPVHSPSCVSQHKSALITHTDCIRALMPSVSKYMHATT